MDNFEWLLATFLMFAAHLDCSKISAVISDQSSVNTVVQIVVYDWNKNIAPQEYKQCLDTRTLVTIHFVMDSQVVWLRAHFGEVINLFFGYNSDEFREIAKAYAYFQILVDSGSLTFTDYQGFILTLVKNLKFFMVNQDRLHDWFESIPEGLFPLRVLHGGREGGVIPKEIFEAYFPPIK
jgi:hypothetical protein